jgi:hypothetical protein
MYRKQNKPKYYKSNENSIDSRDASVPITPTVILSQTQNDGLLVDQSEDWFTYCLDDLSDMEECQRELETNQLLKALELSFCPMQPQPSPPAKFDAVRAEQKMSIKPTKMIDVVTIAGQPISSKCTNPTTGKVVDMKYERIKRAVLAGKVFVSPRYRETHSSVPLALSAVQLETIECNRRLALQRLARTHQQERRQNLIQQGRMNL